MNSSSNDDRERQQEGEMDGVENHEKEMVHGYDGISNGNTARDDAPAAPPTSSAGESPDKNSTSITLSKTPSSEDPAVLDSLLACHECVDDDENDVGRQKETKQYKNPTTVNCQREQQRSIADSSENHMIVNRDKRGVGEDNNHTNMHERNDDCTNKDCNVDITTMNGPHCIDKSKSHNDRTEAKEKLGRADTIITEDDNVRTNPYNCNPKIPSSILSPPTTTTTTISSELKLHAIQDSASNSGEGPQRGGGSNDTMEHFSSRSAPDLNQKTTFEEEQPLPTPDYLSLHPHLNQPSFPEQLYHALTNISKKSSQTVPTSPTTTTTNCSRSLSASPIDVLPLAVEWLPNGKSWRVLRWEALESILPELFPAYNTNVANDDDNSKCNTKAKTIHSMQDFLYEVKHQWGFHQCTELGPDQGSFSHKLFIRGRFDLIQKMKPMSAHEDGNYQRAKRPLSKEDYQHCLDHDRKASKRPNDRMTFASPSHANKEHYIDSHCNGSSLTSTDNQSLPSYGTPVMSSSNSQMNSMNVEHHDIVPALSLYNEQIRADRVGERDDLAISRNHAGQQGGQHGFASPLPRSRFAVRKYSPPPTSFETSPALANLAKHAHRNDAYGVRAPRVSFQNFHRPHLRTSAIEASASWSSQMMANGSGGSSPSNGRRSPGQRRRQATFDEDEAQSSKGESWRNQNRDTSDSVTSVDSLVYCGEQYECDPRVMDVERVPSSRGERYSYRSSRNDGELLLGNDKCLAGRVQSESCPFVHHLSAGPATREVLFSTPDRTRLCPHAGARPGSGGGRSGGIFRSSGDSSASEYSYHVSNTEASRSQKVTPSPGLRSGRGGARSLVPPMYHVSSTPTRTYQDVSRKDDELQSSRLSRIPEEQGRRSKYTVSRRGKSDQRSVHLLPCHSYSGLSASRHDYNYRDHLPSYSFEYGETHRLPRVAVHTAFDPNFCPQLTSTQNETVRFVDERFHSQAFVHFEEDGQSRRQSPPFAGDSGHLYDSSGEEERVARSI